MPTPLRAPVSCILAFLLFFLPCRLARCIVIVEMDFPIFEPDVKVFRHARNLRETDGDGVYSPGLEMRMVAGYPLVRLTPKEASPRNLSVSQIGRMNCFI